MRLSCRAAVVAVLGLLVAGALSAPGLAAAQSTNWVSAASTRDLTGNQVLQSGAQLVAGHTYNTTLTIAVPVGATGSTFTVDLNRGVVPNGSQFWYLLTPGYAGYDRATFTSSLRSVQFNWDMGTLVLSAIYKIPLNLTAVTTGGLTLHLAREGFSLVNVSVTGGVVGVQSVAVVDQSIQTYLSQYQTTSGLISSGQVSSSYSALLQSTLSLSQSMYRAGLTDQATSMLENFTPSSLPTPPSSSYVSYIMIAAILLAILSAVLAILWVRGRGQSGFSSGVISETNRQLASLEVVASRYDKNLADQLKALREKLTEAS